MLTVSSRVLTQHGAKYVQQLCKHWAHKLPADFTNNAGVVTFEDAVGTMKVDAEGITVTLSGEDREALDKMKDVVSIHLDRFAFREAPLTYDWDWG